jgi:hypothetical protein
MLGIILLPQNFKFQSVYAYFVHINRFVTFVSSSGTNYFDAIVSKFISLKN